MSADESPVPDESVSQLHTDEWEAEMRSVLEEGDHDVELGLEMAKDAQRLVAGEISEAEFSEKYHEAVVEEFGEDDRPLEPLEDIEDAGSGVKETLAELESGEIDRREAMKKMGAAGAFLGLGLWATADNADEDPGAASVAADGDDGDKQWGMVIDLNKCDGCLSCVTACAQENHLDQGANWLYVFTYEDDGQDHENFLVRTCQHCTNAPCEKVCPTTARHTRSKDGLVLTDYDVCIGCRYCQVACPYGVNYFQWGEPEVSGSEIDADHVFDDRERRVDSRPPKGVMGKCTMCPSRQDDPERQGTTACEEACSMDAIYFGDVNDPDSDPNRYLEEVREENPNDLDVYPNRPETTTSTFKLLEEFGTEPNVTFVGDEPGPNAEQVEGPVTYEELDLVDERKEVLDDGTFGGGIAP